MSNHLPAWKPWQRLESYRDELLDHGYEFAGWGLYSNVYINHQARRAVKIGFDGSDRYLIWIKTVREMQHRRSEINPYFPHVYDLMIRSTGYIVEMEILKSLHPNTYQIRQARELISALKRVIHGYSACPKNIGKFMAQFNPFIWEVAAVLRMARLNSRMDPAIDLHTGNIMLRGEQLVVTDPLCGQIEDVTKAWRVRVDSKLAPY